MAEDKISQELKTVVLIAAGIETLRPRHCLVISGLIYEKTGKQISVSSLKRIYGFAKQVKTSRYTLNALQEFCEAQPFKKTG